MIPVESVLGCSPEAEDRMQAFFFFFFFLEINNNLSSYCLFAPNMTACVFRPCKKDASEDGDTN